MFGPNIIKLCITALILIIAASANQDLCPDKHEGPCTRSSQCLPLVTPKNSTHLLVNWENVFEGCKKKDLERMEIIIQENESPKESKVVTINQEKTFLLEASPCLKQTITIVVVMSQKYTDEHRRAAIRTPGFQYNNRHKDKNYPFGGLLANEVLPSICLKENGTFVIPSPPEALRRCGVISGEVNDNNFQEVGTTANVRISFNNPLSPNSKTYKMYVVSDIRACTNSTQEDNYNLVIGLAISFTLLGLLLITTLLGFWWKTQAKAKESTKEVDANPVYGIYALNDEGEDVGVTEFRDTNNYYVM